MTRKVLFIEDEADQIMLVKRRLEAGGFEMISAQDGEAGLQKARSEKPDLILLDLLIPKIQGLELCKRLKKAPETRHIPVLIITAYGIRDLEVECRAAGANGVIKKPYNAQDLLSRIKTLLGQGTREEGKGGEEKNIDR